MSLEPLPFQEASRCDVCKCSFNTFRRRHHCRCCGRTLCAEHSSNQMALPQFGLYSSVRVCSDCFNDPSRKGDTPPSVNAINIVADSSSSLDDREVADIRVEPIANQFSQLDVSECKCGMPLCICEGPSPSRDTVISQGKTSTSTVQPYPKPKRAEAHPRSKVSTSSSKNGSVFNIGQVANACLENSLVDYEVTGEGLREAIKNGDTAAVKKLLSEGVDSNYCDKQGMSVLHLAAVFNQTDISFVLMEHGASLDCKNSQGETPLDCATVTLQYRMKKKIKEAKGMGTQNIT